MDDQSARFFSYAKQMGMIRCYIRMLVFSGRCCLLTACALSRLYDFLIATARKLADLAKTTLDKHIGQ